MLRLVVLSSMTFAAIAAAAASFTVCGNSPHTVDLGAQTVGGYAVFDVTANYSLFGNKRSDISIYAIRLYDHALTDAEIARNAEVDRVRFCGESSHGAEGCSICFARVVGLSIIVR